MIIIPDISLADSPLAPLIKGFNLRAGKVSFPLPHDVKPGTYHITRESACGNLIII